MNTPETKPKPLKPLLIEGILDCESKKRCHEGYYNGREWRITRMFNGQYCEISDVTAWEYMPDTLKPSIAETIQAVRQWGIDKGITGPNGKGTVAAQASKLREEANEVFEEVDLLCVGAVGSLNDVTFEIGDVLVSAILLCDMLKLTPEQCLQAAYDKISKRDGQMIDGTFVKNDKASDRP